MEQPEVRVQQEAVTKKERLSDEEMGNLLAAVGNHEAKGITLLVMRDGVVYPAMDLWKQVLQSQGTSIGWRMHNMGPFNYCFRSLAPVGLVTQEILDDDLNTIGYTKTERGSNSATPLVGLELDFSRRYPDYSLMDLFGQTNSSGKTISTAETTEEYKKRSPATRLKILRELVSVELPIKEFELAKRINEDSHVLRTHIRELKRRGVISYQSIYANKAYAEFQLSSRTPDQKPIPYRGLTTLTNTIYQIIQQNPDKQWSIPDLITYYIDNYTTNENREAIDRQLQKYKSTTIPSLLTHLQRLGYIKRRQFSYDNRSEISLSVNQKEMLEDLINILDNFQNQDQETLTRGKLYAQWFLYHPQEISNLLAKAKEKSSAANAVPIQETESRILYLLSKTPHMSTAQLQTMLREEYEQSLTIAGVRNILKFLIQDGRVEVFYDNGLRKLKLMEHAA